MGHPRTLLINMLLGFEENAALDYIKDIYNHNSPLSKIKGGNDQLPRAFAAKLTEVIRYGCAVEHIERSDKGVRVSYRRMGMLDHVGGRRGDLHHSLTLFCAVSP